MKAQLFPLFLFSFILAACGQSGSTKLPNVERVGEFQVGLWVTDDRDFFDRFRNETSTPEFEFITEVGRGEEVFVFLLISNAATDQSGNSNVKMRVSTLRPNGGLSYES